MPASLARTETSMFNFAKIAGMRTRPVVRSHQRAFLTMASLIGLSLCLGSCVISEAPLLAKSKPLLGPQFDMIVYRDFASDKGFESHHVNYRWIDGAYTRNSATTTHIIRFVSEPLGGNDYLIERSQSDRANGPAHVFTYWIGRKVTDGTYLIFPIDEHDLSQTDRESVCAKDQSEGSCIVREHAQLVVAARATASKPIRNPAVGILVDESAREAASIQLVKDRQ